MVKVFSTKFCPHCVTLKEFLKGHKRVIIPTNYEFYRITNIRN